MLEKLKSRIKKTPIFISYIERRIDREEKQRFKKEFQFPENRNDSLSDDDLKHDYYNCVEALRINFSEYYYQYQFYKLSKEEREEFITRAQMQKIYRRVVKPEIRRLFSDKRLFLENFAQFVNRKWILPQTDTTLEDLNHKSEAYPRNANAVWRKISPNR